MLLGSQLYGSSNVLFLSRALLLHSHCRRRCRVKPLYGRSCCSSSSLVVFLALVVFGVRAAIAVVFIPCTATSIARIFFLPTSLEPVGRRAAFSAVRVFFAAGLWAFFKWRTMKVFIDLVPTHVLQTPCNAVAHCKDDAHEQKRLEAHCKF